MACPRTAIILALLSTVALAAELPPHWMNVEDQNGFHGLNNPNFPLDMNIDLASESLVIPALVKVLPENIAVVDEELTPETNDVDEQSLQKIQDENDEQTNEEAIEANNEESDVKHALLLRDNNKVACDFIAAPRVSCYSCYTYIDCKSNGEGKIKQCKSPYAPYCNQGLCSATPTAECDPNPEPEDSEEGSGDANLI